MINNRQQGNRRRGRGGQPPRNIPGRSDGNRQDNRQRGNAAQLLEKYKSMARDSQLAGDRVQTEYYLQYADHYYRVLGESRARFDEQRRQRGEDDGDEDNDDEMMEAGDDDRPSMQQQQRRPRDRDDERPIVPNGPIARTRPERQERYERSAGDDRPERAPREDRERAA